MPQDLFAWRLRKEWPPQTYLCNLYNYKQIQQTLHIGWQFQAYDAALIDSAVVIL